MRGSRAKDRCYDSEKKLNWSKNWRFSFKCYVVIFVGNKKAHEIAFEEKRLIFGRKIGENRRKYCP
jgi:hypothetical protein